MVRSMPDAHLESFIGTNYRMNEFSGGVLLAQTRKLDRIIGDARRNARRIYDGIADLPGLELRKRPDPAGEIGAAGFLGFKDKQARDRFMAGMKVEGLPAQPPVGSVVLPLVPHIMAKRTVHPAWPTFNTPRGKSIQYGPETCRRTVQVLDRFAGVPIDPKYTKAECDSIVAGIRKVYTETRTA